MGEQYHRTPNPLRRLVTLHPLHAALSRHCTHTHTHIASLYLTRSPPPLLDRSFPLSLPNRPNRTSFLFRGVFALIVSGGCGIYMSLSLMRASRPSSLRGGLILSLSHSLIFIGRPLFLFRRLLFFIYRLSDAICFRKAFSADELQNHQLAR